MTFPLSIIGAGTMGSGLAQVAILNGHPTTLIDAAEPQLRKAREAIEKNLARDLEKGRISAAQRTEALSRLKVNNSLQATATSTFVIEAIVEQLEQKRQLFAQLQRIISADCILGTNTSSLSVASISSAVERPERVIGMHFFNPVPIMQLVEVIPSLRTSASVTESTVALAKSWNKLAVLAKDTPGFIVNRIARPFYGESLRILEEGEFSPAQIDAALRNRGFRMGPFELMDLIGNDVNYAVTESVFAAFYFDGRYRPSVTQKRMVESGLLGRKSNRGYFDYTAGAPAPVTLAPDVETTIFMRVICMLINEAAEAVRLKIASASDIELAMTKGVNYPRGLLAWCDELGAQAVAAELRSLYGKFQEERYRISPLLADCAARGTKLSEG